MAWNVITRDKIDLTTYNVTPFGRFSLAEPFLRSLLDSADTVSDLLQLDTSAVGQLRRAACKLAGISNPKVDKIVNGVKVKTKKGKTVQVRKPVTSDQVRQAFDSLGIALECLARSGDGTREFVQVRKVAVV